MNGNWALGPAEPRWNTPPTPLGCAGQWRRILRTLGLLVALLPAANRAWGQHVLATLPVSGQPGAMAVNPATNRVYISGESGVVTVLDATTGARTSVVVGGRLGEVVLNPVTDRVYVAHPTEGVVTVIEGGTLATRTLTVVPRPRSMAVNPVTNKVYVANEGPEGDVAIIDGATDRVAILTVDTGPDSFRHLAVDPVANRIYVTKDADGTFSEAGFGALTVIDGATDTVAATWIVGSRHSLYTSIAVNPVTGRIYLPDFGYSSMGAIDGHTGGTAGWFNAGNPYPLGPVAVNPVTNRLYLVNFNRLLVVDAATLEGLAAIPVGANAGPLAVDPLRNKVYAANPEDGTVTVIDGATHAAVSLAVGARPHSLALNPVTNRVYVGNTGEASVSVIDGATYRQEKLASGSYPSSATVDPVTHKLYVNNFYMDAVSVVDPVTRSTSTVKVGRLPSKVTFDPVANRAYVLSAADSTLTVIEGATLATTTVPVLPTPRSLVLNPATGRLYILGQQSSLMVVEGGSWRTALLPVGAFPGSLAVDPATNRIYVEDAQDNVLRMLDGASHALLATLALGPDAGDLAVDPVRNRIYVASPRHVLVVIDGGTLTKTEVPLGFGNPEAFNPPRLVLDPTANRIFVTSSGACYPDARVTVVDGATFATATQPLSWLPGSMAVNPRTGQLFIVSHGNGNLLTVVDGPTFSRRDLAMDPYPGGVAVDSGTNTVFVPNLYGASVTAIGLEDGRWVPMDIAVEGIKDAQTVPDGRLFATTGSSPRFMASATSAFAESPAYAGLGIATNPPITSLYYRTEDGSPAEWRAAARLSPAGANPCQFGISLSDQRLGIHALHVFATYGEAGGGASMAWSGTVPVPVTSSPQALPFAVLRIRTETTLTADANPQNAGRPVTFTATVRPDHAGASAPAGPVTFRDGPQLLGTAPLVPSGEAFAAVLQVASLAEGLHAITAAYPGDTLHAGSSADLTERIAGMPATLQGVSGSGQTARVRHPFPDPLEVLVLDSRGTPVPQVEVTFLGAGLAFSPASGVMTDAQGMARVTATPTRGGPLTATATVAGVASRATFTLTGGGKPTRPER